jgi:hypothetical protein
LLVTGCHTEYWEVTGVISLFWMFMPGQRIKLTMWRTASTRNWNLCLINSLTNTGKIC